MTVKTKSKERNRWAKIIASVKDQLSKKQDELDKEGIERKAMNLTPDIVDDLRNRLCEAFPAMCEGEGEAVAEVMQVIVDALAEAQPESDVDEERATAGDDKQDEDEDEEDKNSEIITLTRQFAEMGKAFNDLIKDVSEVVDVTAKALTSMNAETKSYSDLAKQVADIKKSLGERPRRASQSTETELDPKSKTAEDVAEKNLSDVPEAFAEIFEGAT